MNTQDDGNVFYTVRHLLHALQQVDEDMLDLPLVLVHGKQLQKPKLIHGLLPVETPVDRAAVEEKPPALLTFGFFTKS